MDKLPFHICTLMAPLIILTRFNKPLTRFKKTIAVFSIVGLLMYITYPGTAIGDVSPFVYKTVQTFFYHGAVFCFGILSVTTGDVKLEFKKIWQELVGLCLIALWAAFGNSVYSTVDQSFD